MREKPIIFSTDMVKAILAGRKTVTRRVMKHEGLNEPHRWTDKGWNADNRYRTFTAPPDGVKWQRILIKTPYQKGDLLWTRETFAFYPDESHVIYRAREGIELAEQGIDLTGCWSSPCFMPKIHARIWLEVLDVRAEKLQEITDEDAIKEGISRLFKPEDIGKPGINDLGGWKNYLWHGCAKGKLMEEWAWQFSDYSKAPRLSFSSLWQSLNAKRGYPWDTNPWVWRYEFKQVSNEETKTT